MRNLLLILFVVALLVLIVAPNGNAYSILPGDILIANGDGHVMGRAGVIKIDPATGAQEIVSAGGLFKSPEDVAVEAGGSLVVSDSSAGPSGGVIRVDSLDGSQALLTSGGFIGTTHGIAVGQNSDLFIASCCRDLPGAVIQVDANSGSQTRIASVLDGGLLVSPFRLKVSASGDLLVVDPDAFGGSGGVIRVDPATGDQTVVSSGGLFMNPRDIEIESDGNLLVLDGGGPTGIAGRIIRVDSFTGDQTLISILLSAAGGGVFGSPNGIAIESSGNILIADSGVGSGSSADGMLIRLNPISESLTILASGLFLVDPYGVSVVPVPEPPAVPAIGPLGIATLLSLMGLVGCRRLRA